MSRCPFDGPAKDQPEPDQPCPVCGDLGVFPAIDEEAPPSRCVSSPADALTALRAERDAALAEVERLTRERDEAVIAIREARAHVRAQTQRATRAEVDAESAREEVRKLREALDDLVAACELPGDHCELEQALRVARAALQREG